MCADEVPGPVKWTRPYFDCGRSNKWLVAAVVPIADIYPRHTTFRHIEYPTLGENLGQYPMGRMVSLAKPPSDKKKKEEILRNRERRMMQMMQGRGGPGPSGAHAPLLTGPPMPRGSVPLQAALSSTRMGRGDYGLYSRFSEDQAAGGFYDEHELWDPGWARTWGNTPWAGWWAPGSANWGAGGRLRGPWGPGPRSSWVPRQSKFSR
ncbi:uncharacterized protein LOC103513784 [Diaphorina citri]|uniref:Uncharacterized protein LOC103513784 n=1 Tax=Diaphorina citri TaxID=121845 RepID=A0A1S3DAC5_DIACI|nr:uncharacterized protein LOC103513784 [Diaphorina citri]